MASGLAGSFDRAAEDYERGRPGWPADVVDAAELPASATVLDLGAGTGKLTRLLASRFERVVAVEPLDAMRALLEELVPEAETLAGSAESIPLADASVDGVFCAEAFHWFDGDRALAEIARVLRPGGALVLAWNVPAGPTEPSITEVGELLERRGRQERQIRRYDSGEWRAPFERAPFTELEESRIPNPQAVDPDGLTAFFASMSWIADLPDEERSPLLEEVRSLLDAPEYRRRWETHLYRTRLRADQPSMSPQAT